MWPPALTACGAGPGTTWIGKPSRDWAMQRKPEARAKRTMAVESLCVMLPRLFENNSGYSSLVINDVLFNIGESLADHIFHDLSVPPHLPQKHGALNHGNAESGQCILVPAFRQKAARLLLDKERRQLIVDHLENQLHILLQQGLAIRGLVPDGA